ncbi:MAG: macrolide ABC transporter ATP-binding protein [Planctomycetes bacterium RBG_13_50_24]|nr:MAG: macrolide ABC transporter ATP-binding protein [Planctomycetes bacterium RBG_13_50_24]
MKHLITAAGICKEFHVGSSTLKILENIDLSLHRGEFIAIMGPSGSGKTTLLYILGCLERPSSGSYLLNGVNIIDASDDELSHLRANNIGFIFQTFNLLPGLNVYENIEAPFLYRSIDDSRIKGRIMDSIAQVGLLERIRHKPSELSGGEMQRVAIARAICADPLLVLADEPTGNLDSHTGMEILKIFKVLHANGSTIILITHNREVASVADRIVYLRDGKLINNATE